MEYVTIYGWTYKKKKKNMTTYGWVGGVYESHTEFLDLYNGVITMIINS